MQNQNPAPKGAARSITLRRDGKGALKFNGERIGAATRTFQEQTDDGENRTVETSARLFKTSGGKYVIGVERYDNANEEYLDRIAETRASLTELLEAVKKAPFIYFVDDDILGELFEDTEIADDFVEEVE